MEERQNTAETSLTLVVGCTFQPVPSFVLSSILTSILAGWIDERRR